MGPSTIATSRRSTRRTPCRCPTPTARWGRWRPARPPPSTPANSASGSRARRARPGRGCSEGSARGTRPCADASRSTCARRRRCGRTPVFAEKSCIFPRAARQRPVPPRVRDTEFRIRPERRAARSADPVDRPVRLGARQARRTRQAALRPPRQGGLRAADVRAQLPGRGSAHLPFLVRPSRPGLVRSSRVDVGPSRGGALPPAGHARQARVEPRPVEPARRRRRARHEGDRRAP